VICVVECNREEKEEISGVKEENRTRETSWCYITEDGTKETVTGMS
jgi:hypothetical protein